MNWEDFRYFLALADEGSFSGAARKLGVDHSTVARRVAALETAFGVRLIDRLPKAVMLTVEGQVLAERGQGALDAMFAVERAAAGAVAGVSVPLCISAPPALARHTIGPQLKQLREMHPDVDVILQGQIQSADLNRRQADIAIRLSRPRKSSVITRKLANMSFGFYGAKAYPNAETDWDLISWDEGSAYIPQYFWLEERLRGRRVVLRSNDMDVQVAAARSGLGIALLPCYIGDADPLLMKFDARENFPAREIWMLVHADLRHAPRVRKGMDFLIKTIGRLS
ncbi:LysR family transcriptional regulator [Thalassospira sp.]|uniref:LysR family transcriptional regulator n=1 Tax=Thalassospira sp. TaxID=1912094 RepID=UPI002735B914|nr:LysR family transcriptional regulator [Thalassospira sp.]MDP2698214.1 LysR family transcriptional regulator [Thalassospira sp.]